jgi:hypothetical protein
MIGQSVHRLFPVSGQALEDRPTRRIGESLENILRYSLHI